MKTSISNFNRKLILLYILYLSIVSTIKLLIIFNVNRDFLLNRSTLVISVIASNIVVSLFFFIIIFLRTDKRIKKMVTANTEILERYEALSNATNDAIWDFDLVSQKVYYNERVSKVFGYSSWELENNTHWWENNIHPEDRERVTQKMNQYLDSNRSSWNDEYRFKCKNGEYKIVRDRSYIVRDFANKPIRLIGAMNDVTRVRSLEKEIFNQQIENKNNLGKRIILSHENERIMIKNDLHEDVNQLLASTKVLLGKYKNETNTENISINNSIDYLDVAMGKIKNISDRLSSSTFELFGLEEGIIALFSKFQKTSNIELYIESESFNEELIDKTISLLLYRIIEDKLLKITNTVDTKEIVISLSNSPKVNELKISFKTLDPNISTLFSDNNLIDTRSKLDMYGGTMEVKTLKDNYYSYIIQV